MEPPLAFSVPCSGNGGGSNVIVVAVVEVEVVLVVKAAKLSALRTRNSRLV
jgi:hypothetical protein